tara:strand:- start:130 stop:429 length:300 start_codon:yes stop_codon:yes gene_type:complete
MQSVSEIKQKYYEQTGREQALEREVANLKECLKIETAALDRLREDTPTMPVIPKDVALAIFREGAKLGASHGLKGLCERYGFECRIHGIDDPQEKKNED